jgi:hypothetical protein
MDVSRIAGFSALIASFALAGPAQALTTTYETRRRRC